MRTMSSHPSRVEVAHAHAHSGQGGSVPVEGAAGRDRDLPEGAVVVVAIEEARRGVAGDVDVGPSVVVEIRRRRPHPVGARGPPVAADERHGGRPAGMGDPRLLRDVDERAVSAVAIEDVRAAGESLRPAGHGDLVVAAVGRVAGPRRPGRIEVHVARHEQVQMAVPVVVEKAAAGPPAVQRSRDPGLLGDVRERAVAVVAVEDVPPPVADEEVVEAVVVVVAHAAGLAPAGTGQAGLLGDVGERAVAVVVEQVARGLAVPDARVEARRVDQEDVEPAVVVVVEESRAAAHLLQQELLVLRAARDVPRVQQAGRGGDVREGGGTGRSVREQPRKGSPDRGRSAAAAEAPSIRRNPRRDGPRPGLRLPHPSGSAARALLRYSRRRIFSSSLASPSRRRKASSAFWLSSALPRRR